MQLLKEKLHEEGGKQGVVLSGRIGNKLREGNQGRKISMVKWAGGELVPYGYWH